MGRTREFDETDVLDRALMVFWRLGYDASAISDLVEATGVQRQSLYNTWGDKRGLFLAAAARYRARSAELLAPLLRSDAGVVTLKRYFEGFLAQLRDNGCGACLLVRTAFSPAREDAEVRRLIEAAAGDVRAAFERALTTAVNNRELARAMDPAVQAGYLFGVLHGLSALAGTGATRKQVAEVMEQAFAHFT